MDFRLDDDQLAIRDAVRTLCGDRFDLATVADREDRAADAAAWGAFAELGILGLLGGDDDSGFGLVEAAIVFEELGTHVISGPVLWTTIASSLVPGAAEGAVRVTGVSVAEHATGPIVVNHGAESDLLVVLHRDRVELVTLAGLEAEPGFPMDPLTPVTILPAVPSGEVVGSADTADQLRRAGQILTAAQLVGGAQGALDYSREYALGREQFGVPIGTFQAIKHMLADMYVRVEMSRAATYAAAAIAAGRGAGDVDLAARSAKHLAGEAGIANGRAAVQVLGGMGFTWEMLSHYFLKRAFVLDLAFGSSGAQAATIGAAVGVEVANA